MGELARNLEDLGYRLDYTDPSSSRSGRITFEPALSDPGLRRFWSTNHERTYSIIRDFEAKYERTPTDAELNQIMGVTRGRKADKEMDTRPVRSRWLDSARTHGFEAPLVHPGQVRPADYDDRAEALWDRLMSAKGLCINDATFTGDTIAIAIARNAIGLGFTREELRQYEQVLREVLVVVRPASDDRNPLYTTQVQLDREQFITERRREKARPQHRAVPEALIAKALARQPVQLDAEQRSGVVAACSATGWVHIEGYAGSGKTTLLAAVQDAHRLAGTAEQFVVVSTAAAAAERTGQKLQANTWGSVESIVARHDAGRLRVNEATVWFVDEAAMMDTYRMGELLRVVGPGRVVLVGDPRQLSPIGAAGWYAESVAEHGATVLSNVHRHRDPRDVRDYGLLRRGQAQSAVENLAMRSRIHVDDDAGRRLGRVLQDYRNMRDHGYRADQIRQVIETSNHDVDTMNRFVQRDRLERGEIKGVTGYEVEDLEQGRRWMLHEGDQVIFLRSYSTKGQETVKNGTTGTILQLGPTGRMKVALDDRILVMRLEASEWSQPVGLAYAQHANKLQGGEVEMVQVLPGTEHTATANSGYSQLTRAQHEAHVYLSRDIHTDDALGSLTRAWSVAYEKRSASWHQEQAVADKIDRPEPTMQAFTEPDLRRKADECADWIAFRYGDDLAENVRQSPAYPNLVMQLDELDGSGKDSRTLLANAIEERELSSAEDPAAVISWRLDQTPQREVDDWSGVEMDWSAFTRTEERGVDRGLGY